MKKITLFIIAMSLVVSLMACDNSLQSNMKDYNDNDIAAIVRDKEITIGELRFLYADEDVLEQIEGAVKSELMIQESKRMGLDISDEINSYKERIAMTSLKDAPLEKSMREFIESQAQKLGMEPDEYFKEYMEISNELNLYAVAYTQKAFRKMEAFNKEELRVYNEELDEFFNELVEKNKEEIEILIK